MGVVTSRQSPAIPGGDDFLLKGGHLRQAAFPFASWPMQDVKILLSTLKKVGTFVMVQSQFNAWISSAVPAITNEEAQELFRLMDTGNNGRVNCLEFLAGIMMLSCEDFAAKTQFCFELYDLNLNGALCYEELVLMVRSTVLGTLRLIQLSETRSLELLADDKPFEDIAGLALRVYDHSMNRSLSYEEFVSWARGNREIMRFVDEFAIFAQAATKEPLHHHSGPGPREGDEALPGSFPEDEDGEKYFSVEPARDTLPKEIPSESSRTSMRLDLTWTYAYSPRKGSKGTAKYLDAKRTRIGYATGTAIIVQDIHACTQTVYTGHRAPINSLDVHPSFQHIASADLSGEIRVWEPRRFENDDYQESSIQVAPGPSQILFSRSGQLLAVATNVAPKKLHSFDSRAPQRPRIEVWDWRAGERIGDPVEIPHGNVADIAWSAGEDCLGAVGSTFAQLWIVQKAGPSAQRFRQHRSHRLAQDANEVTAHLRGPSIPPGSCGSLEPVALDLESICKQQDLQPSSLCFVGKDLVIGTTQGMLIQYNLSARRLEKVVDASMDSRPILHVFEWKAGIVSASAHGELRLWDMGLHPLGTGQDTVGSAAATSSFRSEEKLARNAVILAGSGSANGPILDSSIVVSSMCIVNPVLSKVALIATTSGHIFEINLGEKVSGPRRTKIPIVQALGGGAAPALAVMPQDDSIVVSCSCADARLCVWDSAARRLAASCFLSSPGLCLAFAPNGEYLAVGLASGEISVRLAGSASLLSEEAARIPRSGLDCSGGPVSICFSPDGLRIAAYFSGGAVHVFDVRRHTLDRHKLFTRAQVLRIDAPSAEVPHRAVLGWSHCSSFLKISIFPVNEPMSLRHYYADIARGGHMLEDSLADVRGISWTSYAYPAEEDLQALPNSLRRDACVFDVALGRLAIGDQNGGSSCVTFPCASETTILRACPADSERAPVVCVKFIQGGAALMAAYANGTMAQWAVVENNSNLDGEEKEAKQEAASICDLEFEHEIAQRRLVANSDDSCEEVFGQDAASIPEFDRLCEGDETMPLNDWQRSRETPDTQKSDEHQVLLDAMGVHEGHKDAEVVLDWVQGYNAAGKNIQYLFDRRLAFPACGMVTIVGFNTGSGKLQQRFLRPQHAASLQHREIPAGHRVVEVLATTPRRTHIAFAQGSSVHVWDVETMLMVCEIDLPWAKGGVSHLAFSSDGNLLCVVGGDHMQTVATVEWPTRRVQGFVPSGADSVHDMVWTCEKHFVTVGVRHVTFWKSQRGSAPTSQRGSFASKTGVAVAVQNVYSVCAVDSSTAITGLADGTLAVWDVKTHCITKILNQHQGRVGPCFALCFVPTQMGGFLAGNKAGHVTLWTRAGPDDFEEHVLYKAEEKSKGVGVRAISVISKDQNAQRIAGSNASRLVYGAVAFRDGKITEFIIDTDARSLAHDTAPELLLETHSKGEAWALATHPKEQLTASAADDGKLCLWALDAKKKVAEVEVQRKVISLALSSAEAQDSLGHLAAATDDGFLQVFALFWPPSSTERGLEEISVEHFSDIDALRDWAQVLRYSPDASLLAAGCHDQSIYIFDRSANYVLLHKLAGHTSFVASLDWSLESTQGETGLPLWHLQSICGSRELLYWQVSRSAAQRLPSAGFAKDIEWASWTCTNGWAVSKVPSRAHWTTCARSNGGLHLIAGDKDGNLNLHSFPCAASGRVYKDHAAQVTQVCFSAQDRYVLSLDSRRALCIWQTENLEGICRAREIWAQRSEAEKNHLLDQARQRLAGRRNESQQPNYIEAAAYLRQQFPTKHALARKEADLPWPVDNIAWKNRLPKSALAPRTPLARPADLELDWVYGRSARCGARFVGEQDDVLFVAANLAVIQRPVRDGRLARQSFFWGHDSAIVAVDVSTDGQLIATGDDAGHVMIWREATLQQECSLRVEGGVQQVALSALGSLVAVLTYAGEFTISCAKTGQLKATGGSGPAHTMALVPKSESDTNADIDVILADDTGLRVWTFDPVRNRMSSTAARSPVAGQITCLAFLGGRLVSGHADGALVAWNGASTSVWRIMTKEDLKAPHSRVLLADLATIIPGRDQRELLCISSSGKAIFVDSNLDPLPGDGLEALGVALACGDCDRTGRGAWLFSTQQGRLLEYETFSHSSSELVCGHGSAHQGLECAAFSIDGQPHMVTAGTDARVCIWDLRERKLVREQALPDAATSCAVSVSGHHHIAVGTRSGFLVVFAANLTRQLLQMSIAFLQGSDHSRDAVRSLQYSGDGQRLAVGSDDGQIRILETRNYALVQKLSLEPPNPVTHLDWSCDGTFIRSNGCVQSLPALQVSRLVPKLKQNVYHETQVKDEDGSLVPRKRDPMWNTSTCALTEKTAGLCSSESSRVPVAVAEDCGVVAMSDGRLEGISGGPASRVRFALRNGGQLFAKRDERWLVLSGRLDGLVFQFITN